MKLYLESEFENNKDRVIELIEKNLIPYNKKTKDGLSGIWSVDIMKVDEDYYLIDMAIGCQSAYYDYKKIK